MVAKAGGGLAQPKGIEGSSETMGVTRHPLCSSETLKLADSVPMDESPSELLQASLARVLASGKDFAERFYQRLFSQHPQLRAMFPEDLMLQQIKLRDTLSKVVENLRMPQAVRGELEDLGRAHQAIGVTPEHYPLVGKALVETILESDPTGGPALREEWRQAIELIAGIMLEGSSETA